MKVEIHWPEGSAERFIEGAVTKFDICTSEDIDIITFFDDVVYMSRKYDVIIDNGVITFVEKS